MSGIEMIREMSSTRLLTRIYEKVLHTQPVYVIQMYMDFLGGYYITGGTKIEKYGSTVALVRTFSLTRVV